MVLYLTISCALQEQDLGVSNESYLNTGLAGIRAPSGCLSLRVVSFIMSSIPSLYPDLPASQILPQLEFRHLF
jgi:hypothetical protein